MNRTNNNSKFKIGLVQLNVGPDKEKNLAKAVKFAGEAAKRGACVICLPELFNYMGSFANPNAVAESVAGDSISKIRSVAKKHQVFIVAGSILETADEGLPFNTCFFIAPNGHIVAKYSKMHLFDINIFGKIKYNESRVMQCGDRATVVRTPFGKLGVAICNDLRYPEIFRAMVKVGAQIIFVPSAFTKFTGRDHWLVLNRNRAIENQCYIAAVNQSGKNADGVSYFGCSLVVDPWGNVLEEVPARGDAVIVCEVDLDKVDTIRRQLPALKKIKDSIKVMEKISVC